MARFMIIRKGASVMAALIGVAGTSLLPIASADTLSNGLTVDCKPDSDTHATCIIGGCPRVNGDYVVDAVHVILNGGLQNEYGFRCINGETVRYGFDLYAPTVDDTIGVQGCRKNTLSADWCGPWADYHFKRAPQPAGGPCPRASPGPGARAGARTGARTGGGAGHQRDQGELRSPWADQGRTEGGKLIEPPRRVPL